MKRLFRSKIFWTLLILLVAIRIAAPPLILKKTNEFLDSFSPILSGHVSAFGMSLYRGAYQIKGFELRLKNKAEEQIIYTKVVDVSIAWRDLFKGRITADVLIDGAKVVVTQNVLDALKHQKQLMQDQKKASDKLVPLRIERIDVRDSDFQVADMAQIPEGSRLRLSNIEGRVSNVTSDARAPLTLASVRGNFFDAAPLKVVAQINRQATPLAWDMDLEMKDFKMSEANPWLKKKLPLTFTAGKLDLYSEIKSENGTIEGYFKPFLHNADIVANHESFASLRHFGIEVSTAAVNLLLRNSKNRTLATKVLFAYNDDGFKVNSAKAISEAFKNGFTETLQPGIEDQVNLSAFHQKPTEEKGSKP